MALKRVIALFLVIGLLIVALVFSLVQVVNEMKKETIAESVINELENSNVDMQETDRKPTAEEIVAKSDEVKADAEAALESARALLASLNFVRETEPEEEPTEETVPETAEYRVEGRTPEPIELVEYTGEVLTARKGTVQGPSGKETWYNLDMTGVVWIMEDLGYNYEYHVREDGVKMYGPYIMCACNLNVRPRGTLVQTSLGLGMVCDTGSYGLINPTWIDIATTWK